MRTAIVNASSVEIWCPDRDCSEFPIPAKDGSYLWEALPETIKCPVCEKTFKIGKRIGWEGRYL